MTSGSSMQAMTFTFPPHFSHFSISMRMAAPTNTRFKRFDQRIE